VNKYLYIHNREKCMEKEKEVVEGGVLSGVTLVEVIVSNAEEPVEEGEGVLQGGDVGSTIVFDGTEGEKEEEEEEEDTQQN
jgi:hypothetical protein